MRQHSDASVWVEARLSGMARKGRPGVMAPEASRGSEGCDVEG